MAIAIDSGSGRQTSASWTHTADANDRAIVVFCMGFTAITGFTHAASAVSYGNVALTLKENRQAVSSHYCMWVLDDWASFDGRDDDVVRVTGGSWGGSNGQYAGYSVLLESASHAVALADDDGYDNIALGNGNNASATLTASGTGNIAVMCGVTNGTLTELAGQTNLMASGHHIGFDYVSYETGLSGSPVEGYQNNSGSNESVVMGVALFAQGVQVELATVTPETVHVEVELPTLSVQGLNDIFMHPDTIEVEVEAAQLSFDTQYPSALPLVNAMGVPQRVPDPSGLDVPMLSHDGIQPVYVEAPSGSIEVAEGDGVPDVSGVTRVEFTDSGDATVTVTDDGGGQVTVNVGVTVPAGLVVTEDDASPNVTAVDKLVFPAGTVTDLGSGDVSVKELPTGSICVSVGKSTDQLNFPASTLTKVTFDTTHFDTDSMFDNANDRLICRYAGRYLVSGQVALTAFTSATTDAVSALYKNGSSLAIFGRGNLAANEEEVSSIALVLDLAVNDYLEIFVNPGSLNNVGDVRAATAPTWFQMHKLGSGNVAGLDTARAKRTSGAITANSTTWANVDTALDLVVPAQAGDVLLVNLSVLWGNAAVFGYLDAATIVAGSPVNYIGSGGASDEGVTGWGGDSGQYAYSGAGVQYVVVAGDISGGMVTLRLRYRTNVATNKTLYATTGDPLQWSVVNLRSSSRRGYPSGTAFPTGAVAGDLFRRTDIRGGMLFRHDGTRWLSDQEYVHTAGFWGVTGSGTVADPMAVPDDVSAIYFHRVDCKVYAAATNNGSNYWNITLQRYTFANVYTTVAQAATSGSAADTWVDLDVTSPANPSVDGATYAGLRLLLSHGAGAPGAIYGSMRACYRLVAT